jgi:hypothetical protein
MPAPLRHLTYLSEAVRASVGRPTPVYAVRRYHEGDRFAGVILEGSGDLEWACPHHHLTAEAAETCARRAFTLFLDVRPL